MGMPYPSVFEDTTTPPPVPTAEPVPAAAPEEPVPAAEPAPAPTSVVGGW